MMLVLFLNLLHDALHFNSLPFVDSKGVLVVTQSSAHAIQGLSNLTLLVGHKTLGEKALSACIILVAKLFPEPVQDNCEMLFSFVVEDEWDLNLIVLCHDHEVVLNDVVFPDYDDLLEESLCVHTLTSLQEKLAHVEIGSAQVD